MIRRTNAPSPVASWTSGNARRNRGSPCTKICYDWGVTCRHSARRPVAGSIGAVLSPQAFLLRFFGETEATDQVADRKCWTRTESDIVRRAAPGPADGCRVVRRVSSEDPNVRRLRHARPVAGPHVD
jgi:hypothetical protein